MHFKSSCVCSLVLCYHELLWLVYILRRFPYVLTPCYIGSINMCWGAPVARRMTPYFVANISLIVLLLGIRTVGEWHPEGVLWCRYSASSSQLSATRSVQRYLHFQTSWLHYYRRKMKSIHFKTPGHFQLEEQQLLLSSFLTLLLDFLSAIQILEIKVCLPFLQNQSVVRSSLYRSLQDGLRISVYACFFFTGRNREKLDDSKLNRSLVLFSNTALSGIERFAGDWLLLLNSCGSNLIM
jgi:hypothetical protein